MFQIKRKIALFLFLLLSGLSPLFSQQIPVNSSYLFNMFQINPAYTGFKEVLEISSMFRKQWSGIQNSPQVAFASLDMPIPYKRASFGLQITEDRQEVSKALGAQLSYSYKIPLSSSSSLSLGIQSGLFDYSIDYSKVNLIDMNDPMFNQQLSSSKLNFGAGMYLHIPSFYLSLSSSKFIYNKLNDAEIGNVDPVGGNTITQIFQTFIHSGYNFTLGNNMVLKPSVLLRSIQGKTPTYDFNTMLSVTDQVSLGVSYREKSALVGIINLKIIPDVYLGYSYDYNTTQFNTIIKGSHEVMLRYQIRLMTEPSF